MRERRVAVRRLEIRSPCIDLSPAGLLLLPLSSNLRLRTLVLFLQLLLDVVALRSRAIVESHRSIVFPSNASESFRRAFRPIAESLDRAIGY